MAGDSSREPLAEREKRLSDALACRVPDRVPIYLRLDWFPVKYTGMSFREAFYDVRKYLAAVEKTVLEYEPDVFKTCIFDGVSNDTLQTKFWSWAGAGGPEGSQQFVENEYMKAEEYDAFLRDPSDFVMRTMWPRLFGALTGLKMLPPARAMLTFPASPAINTPEVTSALSALAKAARETADFGQAYDEFVKRMADHGFPIFYQAGGAGAPFDVISDFLRGMRGAMLDMYRCPDKLLAAEEIILKDGLTSGVPIARMTGNPRVFIALHRGSDGFMSLEQFEKFYWPQLKRVILAYVEAGTIPCVFFEGVWDQRLKYLAELPPGKVAGIFDRTDLVKAKKILSGIVAIIGGMPSSLLKSGTPQQIRNKTKELIDSLGQDGGFVMCSSSPLDEADPELLRVWVEATREYGG